MGFIRIKRIKGHDYAYLVDNVWRKRPKGGQKGARQKVKRYLGRVINPEKTVYEKNHEDFFTKFGISEVSAYLNKPLGEIVSDLVRFELMGAGFSEIGKDCLAFGRLCFSMKDFRFYRDFHGDADEKRLNFGPAKKAVLAIHDGYLCHETIMRIIKGTFLGDEREVGMQLAKAFVEAGIDIPHELFVGIYHKITEPATQL